MKTINSFRSKLFALTLTLMASVSTFAYDFQSGYLFYNILPDGTVAVTSETYGIPYDYLPNSLVIPSEVNGYNGETYVVTEIANYAFSGCSMLDTLVIPNTVKKIGMYAFTGCTKLVYISFPESIEDILGGALYECAWYNNLPDGLIYIGNLLYRYKGTAPTGTIVVKDGTKAILDFTFSNQPNIQSVVLPESVTSIHIQAFGDCPNLESVVLPSKLEAIEDHTFQYCEKLTNIKLPDALKLIGKNAFIGCTNLTKLTLHSSVQIIEDEAFANCTSLTEVTCYATIPPVRGDVVSDSPSDWFFAGVDVAKIPLYVPTESIDLYKKAEQWMFFNPILPIEPSTSYKSQWCNEWNVMFSNGSVYPPSNMPYRYQLAKDTVIGDYTYTAVVSKAINDALDAPRYVAAVRFTDDRKVYIYYNNAEYLLYDFNVQEGDELEVFAGINNYRFGIKTYKCIVTGVEQYACLGCPATITLHVPNHPDDFTEIYRRTQWQEGVGDVYSGFLNGVNGYVPVDGGGSVHLLCAYQGDELKYTGPLYEEYGCGDDAEQSPEDLFPTLWGLQRTVCNEYCGETEDDNSANFTYKQTFDSIFFENDKPYILCNGYLLREEDNKIFLYSQSLNKDIVLYDFTLEVGDSLPAYIKDFDGTMYSDDTLVVTDISSVTLLDGKEYKKWTFDNGMEYVEGIGMYGGHRNGNFFGLIQEVVVPCHTGTHLVCVSKNGKLLYQMDEAEMERLGAECLCETTPSYKSQWCDTWNVMWFDGMRFDETASTSQYRLGKDTVIGDYIYSKFTSRTSVRFTSDRKVYVYYEGFDDNDPYTEDLPTGEYLAYDFSAQVGDTLEVFSGSHSYTTEQCVVYDVQTDPETNLRTIMLHPLCVVDGDGNVGVSGEEITWLEGVGSPNGFLISTSPTGGGIFALLCAYKGDELKYTGPLYEEYGCEYNAGPFNEKLLGTWRVVGGNEIISISDSIIVFIGLTQKYTASATQLTVERLWIPEEESYRWANCNYTLSNDTLWIDNFMPLLVATYPPTFGPITLVKVKHEDLFPTLWGLQRTSCTKTIGEDEYGTVWGSRSYLMQETQTTTIDGKQYIVFGDEYDRFALREENNKILLYSSILKKDLVLYDFTLEVGDSLPALYYELRAHDTMHQWLYIGDIVDYNKDDDGTILPAETFVVTDISTITLLDGKEYKKWTFDNGMEYVEGIGSFGTSYAWNDFYQLIANGPLYSDVHSQHLVCASKNGQLLYKMDDAEMEQLETECLCEYNAEQKPEDLFPTLWGLQRTTFYHYTECSDSYSSLTASNEIVTINDKPYLRFGKMFLREENNQVLIYSAAYDKDLVLYDWNLEVGDSISLLAMDYGVYPEYAVSVVDYRVIVDIDENGDLIMDTIPTDKVVVDKISTITLLDGKEYKTWHLATGWAGGITYVEGIGILSEGYGGGDYLGLIRPEELPTCYYGDLLVCVSKNNKLLYQMDPVKMDELGAECLCDYNRGPRKDNAKDGQIGGRPTPTQWNQLEVVLRQMDNNHTILQAETFSYTLEDISQQVNNKTYFQLARQSTKDTATTKSFVGALHFGKDEDNRVYFLRDGVEYVLYDFTAEIGDTVEIFAGINNYPQETTYTHVVVDKDTTEDGACRMFLEVVFPEETTTAENAEKVWLAGLGSVDGIVHNAAKRTSNAHAAPSRSASSSETESSVMLCAWREDSCLYTTNHPDYETFGCVYNQDPTSVEDISTSQSSYQKIIREGQFLILHNGKTYSIMGIEL